MHFSPNPREGREGPVAALTEDARPWGNSSSRGKGVARRILSNETLEGGSMIPFLEASEAYWKVRGGEQGRVRSHDALGCGPLSTTRS